MHTVLVPGEFNELIKIGWFCRCFLLVFLNVVSSEQIHCFMTREHWKLDTAFPTQQLGGKGWDFPSCLQLHTPLFRLGLQLVIKSEVVFI